MQVTPAKMQGYRNLLAIVLFNVSSIAFAVLGVPELKGCIMALGLGTGGSIAARGLNKLAEAKNGGTE
ncbi:MAG: hypothetical protein GY722_20535 [bacterium]|nr:hypothetical protein [bacterium]